ncbi:monooxygenase activity protein [Pleurotus ostreatus]|nr:monooxygenase activity protein [Pleurotus ostreatus]
MLPLLFTLALPSLFLLLQWWRRPKHLPGPVRLPVIGNVLSLEPQFPWLTYCQWGKEYGSPFRFEIFGKHVVVANTAEVASELMDRRSSGALSKPRLEMVHLMGWDFALPFMSHPDLRWKLHRKLLQRELAAKSFHPILKAETEKFLGNLLDSPNDFWSHIAILSSSIMIDSMYGGNFAKQNRYLAAYIHETFQMFLHEVFFASPALYAFPWLKHFPEWLPGIGFKRTARRIRQRTNHFVNAPFNIVKEQIVSGSAPRCWVADILSEGEIDEEDVKAVAATAVIGSMTTEAAIKTFFLAMALHPLSQRLAQKEIEAKLGPSRLPDFEDRSSLPYVTAIVREVLRWHPPAPLGAVHTTTCREEYEGYTIPQDSSIVANIWAMSRDEEMYGSPDIFEPGRWITPDGHLKANSTGFMFGFGRRVCPGKGLAEDFLWLVIARVLSAYSVAKDRNAHGEVDLTEDYDSSLLFSQPRQFQCSITPRSPQAHQMISSYKQAAELDILE